MRRLLIMTLLVGLAGFVGCESDPEVQHFTKEIKNNPANANGYFKRGMAYSRLGKYDKAIKDYSEALITDNKYFPAYSGRGFAYSMKGEYDKAIADYNAEMDAPEFQAVAAHDPSILYTAYQNRALVYSKKGDHDKTIEDYNRMLKMDPKNAPLYNLRGLEYSAKGAYEKAIKDFTQSLVIDPKNQFTSSLLEDTKTKMRQK